MDRRQKLVLSAIVNVGTFDEKEILLESTMGNMTLKGEGLHITQLNLDEQTLIVEGMIKAIIYTDGDTKGNKTRGLLEKILR
jgi:sporulation protein YabP